MMVNRPEFHLVDTGALLLGAVPYSIYNTFAPEQIRHLLDNSAARVVVCEQQFLPAIRAARSVGVEHIVCIDGEEAVMTLAALEAAGDAAFDVEASWQTVGPDDLVTLVYTSGRPGHPRGSSCRMPRCCTTSRRSTPSSP